MPTSDGSTGWTPPYEYDPSSDTPYPIWLTDPEGPTYRFILGLAEQSASLLQAAHEATGLPWWATIVVGTAAARAAFLPLQMYAIRNASRAFDAREDMGRLVAAHRAALQRLGPAASPMERLAATRVLIRGMQAALHDANCYPWRTFAVPFLQIPAAVLAVLGARHLVLLGDESFETGGALWFTDLTVADSTYALPVVCVGLTYAFLEYVFRKPRDGGAVVGGAALLSDTLMRRFKSGLQLWTLMAIPLSSTMPAGLYMGWLTGTLYGFAYVTTIRTDAVHALITGRTASRYRAGGDGGGDDLFDLPGITGGAGGDDAAAQDAAGVAGAGVLSIEPGRAAASAAAAARQAREGADADVASRSRLLLEGDPDSRGGLADPERRQQPMSPEDERHMAELKERIDEWLVRDPSAGDFDDFELGHLESADDAVVEHWLDKATRSEWHTHMDKAARADPPTDEELRSASSDCFSAWRGGGRAAASPSGRGSRVIVVDEDSDEHAAGPSPAASAEQDGSRPEVLRSRKVGGAAGDGGGDGDQSGAAAGAGAGERRASLIDGSGRVISSAVSGAIRSEGTHADADHEAWRGGGPAAGAGVPSWDAHHRTEASDRGTASLASAASAAVAGRRRQAAANASAARRPAAKEAGRRAAGTAPADEDWSTANLGDVLRSALADADDPSGTTDAESEDLLSGFDDMDGDGDDAAGRIGAQRSEHRMVKEERSITTAPIDALRLAPGRVGGVGFLPVVPLSRLMAGQGPVRGEQPLAAALRPPNGGTPPTPIPISAQHHLEMSRNGFTHLPEPGQEQDLLAGVREELKAISEQESSQGFEHAGGRVRRLQRELQNLIRDERRRGGGGGGGRGGGGSGASGGGDRR
ncbi:hypothetical protein FNF28_02059 [Cafeteria roenbergensis]|uniref:Uncharacterized protein n=1 Tax=Cafeteria roenbergensis TaxID=33653 RepID=A0A5A8DXZ3_CAFRO|nr:hypothetical protein FNF28_02059 [Cafeteria roenbergensis]